MLGLLRSCACVPRSISVDLSECIPTKQQVTVPAAGAEGEQAEATGTGPHQELLSPFTPASLATEMACFKEQELRGAVFKEGSNKAQNSSLRDTLHALLQRVFDRVQRPQYLKLSLQLKRDAQLRSLLWRLLRLMRPTPFGAAGEVTIFDATAVFIGQALTYTAGHIDRTEAFNLLIAILREDEVFDSKATYAVWVFVKPSHLAQLREWLREKGLLNDKPFVKRELLGKLKEALGDGVVIIKQRHGDRVSKGGW
jgi:hypothetical protein